MNIKNFIIPLIIVVAGLCVCLVIRWVILYFLKRHREKSNACRVAYRVLRFPSYLWCIIGALALSIEFWDLNKKLINIANLIMAALAIISVTFVAAKILEEIVYHYLGHIKSPFAKSGLIRGVIKIVIFMLGLLILLSHFGVNIGALLTALGIGGITLGLALQDTLSNVFAGIGLLVDRAITVGSRIILPDGQNGQVEDIGWRTTRVRLESNDIRVISNTEISKIITIRQDGVKKV